jgi:hypothetical protein
MTDRAVLVVTSLRPKKKILVAESENPSYNPVPCARMTGFCVEWETQERDQVFPNIALPPRRAYPYGEKRNLDKGGQVDAIPPCDDEIQRPSCENRACREDEREDGHGKTNQGNTDIDFEQFDHGTNDTGNARNDVFDAVSACP